ncbi:hypothetical protein BDB01DRAFT_850160 [Pilobolus umbonatus]|nr:hypothetical protein BDB01DRAFT_850160 [Pilobolus umbonatus]
MEPRTGEARIKQEYRKERWFDDEVTVKGEMALNDDEAEAVTEVKSKRKNVRGANKGQRGKKRIEDTIRLCKFVSKGLVCPYGLECKLSHDLESYLKIKPADIGTRCVQFELFGRCPYGYKCRYMGAHTDEKGRMIVNEEIVKKNPVYTTNGISDTAQKALLKNKYEFPKSDYYLEVVKNMIDEQHKVDANNALKRKASERLDQDNKVVVLDNAVQSVNTLGNESDAEEFFDATTEFQTSILPNLDPENPLGPIDLHYKKLIDFRDKTYLAPLTTVGNLPFRRICKGFGVDVTCGEMALAFNLLKGQQSEWALTKRHKSEDIFGVQICGSKVEHVVKACEALNNEIEVDFIDLNMGCPIDLVFKQGAGSALLEARGRMAKMLRGMQVVTDIPITAKFRMGIKNDQPVADRIVTRLDEMNIALGTIHGRSRMQRYTKKANWEYVGELKKLSKKMPIYGNGDIMSFEDYNQSKAISGADGIMIGRGALIKPWIFDEIKNQRHWDISANERLDILKSFCDFGLEHWGSDSQGVNTTRRFLCEWQSFLYRYIPVGLLERPPQHMNERPPPYHGRNDLETLMASPLSSDWVKISELILGPAPDDFIFLPKHKANSFEVIEVNLSIESLL